MKQKEIQSRLEDGEAPTALIEDGADGDALLDAMSTMAREKANEG